MKHLLFLICLSQSAFAGHDHAHDDKPQHKSHSTVAISDKAISDNGISLLTAGPEKILITQEVLGKIIPNANKTIFLYPRYNGIIKSLTKQLGDKVKKGDLLAKIESDSTLQVYDITAPFSGYIVRKNANPGEHVTNNSAIYRLADLSQVWVELFIYRKNARKIHKGQSVTIFYDNHNEQGQTTVIDYVSPLGIEHSQTMLARTVLHNHNGTLTWLPGLYVDAHITVQEKNVPIAVKNAAIQTIENQAVVFVKTATGFKAMPIITGLKGEYFTQVLSGIKAGEKYVANHAFLLKAELEKNMATHSH